MSSQSPIPLFSPAAANQGIDLAGAMNRVLRSNRFVLGTEVASFETEFAEYTGTAHCVALANGTDAIELALRAIGVAPGDEVACVANAGFYSSAAIHLAGASPLYVDVDERKLTMCPEALAQALMKRPAAVIVTHLYGQIADMDRIARACHDAGVALVEDCAQAHGARLGRRHAGSFADIGCFSFYPTKNLGAIGDGGAVVTQDVRLAGRVRELRQYGWSRKYEVARPGGRNSRLDELQAAVLREKLPRLNEQNAHRRAVAIRYNEAFRGLPVRLPASTGEDFVAHLYVVRTSRREALRAKLLECGIATDVHYPIADTFQPVYQGRREAEPLPVTQNACATVMSLPCFPGMTDDQVAHVIRSFKAFFAPAGACC